MNKGIKTFLLVLLISSLTANIASAKNVSKIFLIKDENCSNYLTTLKNKDANLIQKENALYSIAGNFVYIKAYPVGKNLNIFIFCDDEKIEKYVELVTATKNKSYNLADKDLTKIYTSDVKQFITQNNIFVDDIIVDKNTYNPYEKELKNKIIRTTKYEKDGISFVTNKMKMKTKIKRFVDGYEILVTNNTGKDIVLKQVNTGDFMGQTEIAKRAMMWQAVDFIPVYGIVTGVKTDLEKNKFTRPFPINYNLKTGETLRILGIAKLQVEPIIDFVFEINKKEKIIQLHTYQ